MHFKVGGVLCCRRENRTEDAIRMWERCISLDPQYGSAYLWLAQLAQVSGAWRGEESAGELLRLLNQRATPSPKHRVALADWLLHQGKTV